MKKVRQEPTKVPDGTVAQPERFVTTVEAAAFLGMSRGALFQAVNRGAFPAYRLGTKRLRFKLSELTALLQPLSAGNAPSTNEGRE